MRTKHIFEKGCSCPIGFDCLILTLSRQTSHTHQYPPITPMLHLLLFIFPNKIEAICSKLMISVSFKIILYGGVLILSSAGNQLQSIPLPN